MNDKDLQKHLRRGYVAASRNDRHATPDFDTVWDAAQAQHQSESRRRVPWPAVAAGLAAAAAIGLFSIVPRQQTIDPNDVWLTGISDSVLNSAAWYAPSDVLLERDGPDIYSSLPSLFESTEPEVETLL